MPWQYEIDTQAYLLGSTILSVFLWQILYSGSIYFVLGYAVVLLNSCILLGRGALLVHKTHVYFLLAISLFSATAATIYHNPVSAMLAQVLGITIYTVYYYSFLVQRSVSLTRIMEIYSGVATAMAILGIVRWLVERCYFGNSLFRQDGWFSEPSHYVYATLPALTFLLHRWRHKGVRSVSAVILLGSYVLSDSSVGFLGLILTLLLMADLKSFRRIMLTLTLTAVTGFAAYSLSDNVKLRVDGTLNAKITSEVDDLALTALQGPSLQNENTSTLSLLSNGYVTYQSLLRSPLIGQGLGTHTLSYEKYAPDVISHTYELWGLNRYDACSLALRLLSDTGIIGLGTVIFLIVYFGRVHGTTATILRNAMIPYFAMRLMRFGAYFSPELYFYAGIYVFNYLDQRRAKATGEKA